MPIIESLLDNDLYQFTMGQVIHGGFGDVRHDAEVVYEVINRNATVELAEHLDLDQLREEIRAVEKLYLPEAEIQFLRETGIFGEEYLQYLRRGFVLPPVDVRVVKDRLQIRTVGPWVDGVLWETPLLALIQELFFRSVLNRDGLEMQGICEQGLGLLQTKIDALNQHRHLEFLEFGTRRRFSADWQREVVRTLGEQLRFGQMIGTSNVKLAFDMGIPTSGTMAHQLFMVASALAVGEGRTHPLVHAQNEVLDAWEAQYADVDDGRLLVALPDTYGSAFFLRHFGRERAERWRGFRQDSGDPIRAGEAVVQFYRDWEIQPAEKLLLPSDGLDVGLMIGLFSHFNPTIPTKFGIGTNLTNDMGIPTMSLVMKPVEVNGQPVVKLSDNIAKATGDPEAIKQYLELAGHGSAQATRR
jgi:nicotinate phosphoribosyltransferase